jgi:hypothetical protein
MNMLWILIAAALVVAGLALLLRPATTNRWLGPAAIVGAVAVLAVMLLLSEKRENSRKAQIRAACSVVAEQLRADVNEFRKHANDPTGPMWVASLRDTYMRHSLERMRWASVCIRDARRDCVPPTLGNDTAAAILRAADAFEAGASCP